MAHVRKSVLYHISKSSINRYNYNSSKYSSDSLEINTSCHTLAHSQMPTPTERSSHKGLPLASIPRTMDIMTSIVTSAKDHEDTMTRSWGISYCLTSTTDTMSSIAVPAICTWFSSSHSPDTYELWQAGQASHIPTFSKLQAVSLDPQTPCLTAQQASYGVQSPLKPCKETKYEPFDAKNPPVQDCTIEVPGPKDVTQPV